MTPRLYEITVQQHISGSYGWEIQVDGETIALGRKANSLSATEALWDAQSWAYMHKQLGYPMVANWWEHLG